VELAGLEAAKQITARIQQQGAIIYDFVYYYFSTANQNLFRREHPAPAQVYVVNATVRGAYHVIGARFQAYRSLQQHQGYFVEARGHQVLYPMQLDPRSGPSPDLSVTAYFKVEAQAMGFRNDMLRLAAEGVPVWADRNRSLGTRPACARRGRGVGTVP
jgi:hypothetical protein